MLTIETELQVEKDFKEIVDQKFNGDTAQALISFIEYVRAKDLSWDEKFQLHVNRLRQTVKKMGGITVKQIDTAIKRYRKRNLLTQNGLLFKGDKQYWKLSIYPARSGKHRKRR